MSFLIRAPFELTRLSLWLTEKMVTSTPVVFAIGFISGWLVHQRESGLGMMGVQSISIYACSCCKATGTIGTPRDA